MYQQKIATTAVDRFIEQAPVAQNAFIALDRSAHEEGALGVKTKELIALAVAHATQCIYCIELHNDNARANGATDSEIAETILVAATVRAGGTVAHGPL
jgi:AhpD family alkylhydroperoxidase